VTAERSDGPILRWLRTRSDRVSRKLTEEQCTLLAQKPPEASIAPRPETSAVILHHSATPDGSVSLFRVLHRAVFGWDDVGYHFVIGNGSFSPDGAVEEGRPREATGAHARGFNEKSLGICLVGDFSDSMPTPCQVSSLAGLLSELLRIYGLGAEAILLHREVPGCVTECPGARFTRKYLESDILPPVR